MDSENTKGKLGFAKILGIFVLAAILLFLVGGSIFFRVHTVEVGGSEMYSQEEILDMSGVSMGDHLFFVSSSEISANLMASMPYAQSVQVFRRLPDTLIIEVTEAIPVATVDAGGKWIIDQNGKILAKVVGGNDKGLFEIKGLELCEGGIGEYISEDGQEKITAQLVGKVLAAMVHEGMTQDISRMQAEGTSHITFLYDNRLEVILGSAIDADEKLALMGQVLEKLEPDAEGTLDLSSTGEARYIPEI